MQRAWGSPGSGRTSYGRSRRRPGTQRVCPIMKIMLIIFTGLPGRLSEVESYQGQSRANRREITVAIDDRNLPLRLSTPESRSQDKARSIVAKTASAGTKTDIIPPLTAALFSVSKVSRKVDSTARFKEINRYYGKYSDSSRA